MGQIGRGEIEVFSTCPPSNRSERQDYLQTAIDAARWSEAFGCRGILVYTDNGLVDPWLMSQLILLNTETICPLVAIQPAYMHPYAASKMVASCAHFHGRQMYLNMLAGGFRNDLLALNDTTPHDDRYVRMVEYTSIMRKLLEGPNPVSFEGKYYRVDNLKMTPPVPAHLFPGILSSGSSDAGMETARNIEATPVKYPKPPCEEENYREIHPSGVGIRVGIIARESSNEAWKIARERFPEERQGQLMHELATKVSDSVWHKQLAERHDEEGESPYWLFPFQNYKTFCPYLVGSYDEVAQLLARYFRLGSRTVILDVPPSEEELSHIEIVFAKALDEACD